MFTARPATKKKLTRIKPTDLTFVFGLKKKRYLRFYFGHFCLSMNFYSSLDTDDVHFHESLQRSILSFASFFQCQPTSYPLHVIILYPLR